MRASSFVPLVLAVAFSGSIFVGSQQTMAKKIGSECLAEIDTKPNGAATEDAAGQTALHLAAKKESLEEIKELALGGADVNVLDRLGHTPLYYAVKSGNRTTTNALLQFGASPTLASPGTVTPLIAEARNNRSQILHTLMLNGASAEVRVFDGECESMPLLEYSLDQNLVPIFSFILRNDTSAVDEQTYVKAILLMVRDNKLPQAELLLTRRPAKFRPTDTLTIADDEMTFIRAAGNKQPALLRFLIQMGMDVNVRPERSYSGTALGTGGNIEIARILLQAGADPDLKSARGKTPLMVALQSNEIEKAEFLLANGANPEVRDSLGLTALMISISTGSFEKSKLLLEAGADPTAEWPELKDMTKFWSFPYIGNGTKLVHLLLDNGFDITWFEERGHSPLFDVRSVDEMRSLLERGLNIHVRRTRGGGDKTLLHYFATYLNIPMVRFLLEQGMNPNSEAEQHKKVLHYVGRAFAPAVMDRRRTVEQARKYDADALEMSKLLIEYGADIHAIAGDESVAHTQVLGKNNSALRYLMRLGVYTSQGQRDRDLGGAMGWRNVDAATLLLLDGARSTADMEHLRSVFFRDEFLKEGMAEYLMALLEAAEAGQPLPVRPGFDCTKAANAIEKTICGDAELSRADFLMSVAYLDTRDFTIAGDKKALLGEQRSWLRERRKRCIPFAEGKKADTDALNSCILELTTARTKALEKHLPKNNIRR